MALHTLLDLFCGAGGLSLGFCLTNRFQLLAGIDNNLSALKTFYANHPEASTKFAMPQDICTLTGEDLLLALNIKRIDVIIGGPPCQGFSVAGKREMEDSRNHLVWDFFRLITELHPRAFVMENVPGVLLAKDPSGQKLIDVLRDGYEAAGYKCTLWRLNAIDYGVPQVRKRTFLIGVKGCPVPGIPEPTTLSVKDLFNTYSHVVTVADAFSDLPEPIVNEPQHYNGGPYTDYQRYLRKGSEILCNHTPSIHKPDMVERLRRQKPATRLYPNWNHSWYKLDFNRPAPTVKENHRAPFVHPTEPRVTTPRECARLQSFPDRYLFYGTKTAQLIQIGNAVPPLLGQAIANQLVLTMDGG